MTQQAELLNKINSLPPQFFGEVIDFVGYLQAKAQQTTTQSSTLTKKSPNGRVFGCSKGKYNVSDAFFEPLEDFKDYM